MPDLRILAFDNINPSTERGVLISECKEYAILERENALGLNLWNGGHIPTKKIIVRCVDLHSALEYVARKAGYDVWRINARQGNPDTGETGKVKKVKS